MVAVSRVTDRALVNGDRGGLACRLVDELTAEQHARLDAFLAASPATSYMQRLSWPTLAPLSRLQRFRYLWCERDGDLVLGGVVRFTKLFPGRYLAVFPRGPVVRHISDLGPCLPQVKESLRRAGASTVLMNPRWEDRDALEVHRTLVEHGFNEVPRAEQAMYPITGLVDLTRPEEDILASFKQRCRRHLRGAARKGLTVRPAASEEDAARLKKLVVEFGLDKGLDVGAQPDLMDQWRFVQAEGGVFLLAEVEGQLVGGHVAFREGSRAVWMVMASTPVMPKLPRSYNLLWEALRLMKGLGCAEFDLAGVPFEGDEDEGKQKRQFFKAAFNPRVAHLVPIHAAVLRPLSHAFLFRARQAYRRSSLRHHLTPLLRR